LNLSEMIEVPYRQTLRARPLLAIDIRVAQYPPQQSNTNVASVWIWNYHVGLAGADMT
jgi:hypothetical protein